MRVEGWYEGRMEGGLEDGSRVVLQIESDGLGVAGSWFRGGMGRGAKRRRRRNKWRAGEAHA